MFPSSIISKAPKPLPLHTRLRHRLPPRSVGSPGATSQRCPAEATGSSIGTLRVVGSEPSKRAKRVRRWASRPPTHQGSQLILTNNDAMGPETPHLLKRPPTCSSSPFTISVILTILFIPSHNLFFKLKSSCLSVTRLSLTPAPRSRTFACLQ